MHGERQRKREEQLRLKVEEEMQRIQAEKESIRASFRRRQSDGLELDPVQASQRLFENHRTQQCHLQELRGQRQEEEQRLLEEKRFRARGSRDSGAAGAQPLQVRRSSSDAILAGARLHQDAQRRHEDRRRIEMERWADELKGSIGEGGAVALTMTSGASTRSTSARRGEQLYRQALAQRERLEQKREEAQVAELGAHSSSKRSSLLPDQRRLEQLYKDASHRQEKQAALLEEKRRREIEEDLAIRQQAASLAALRSRRRSGSATVVGPGARRHPG